MAAMCNRGDALMYATEFSQAIETMAFTLQNDDYLNQMVPSFYHIS